MITKEEYEIVQEELFKREINWKYHLYKKPIPFNIKDFTKTQAECYQIIYKYKLQEYIKNGIPLTTSLYLDDIDMLSTRVLRILSNYDIDNLKDLHGKTIKYYKSRLGVGYKALYEIIRVHNKYGIELPNS